LIELLQEAPPTQKQRLKRFYLPELDGLRFYAFLSVFISHSLPAEDGFYRGLHLPAPSLWSAAVRSGGAGVDLFFALSAFLITSLLLKERQETGGISLRLFYIRRILRIWPLYFLVVGLGILFAHTMSSFHWYYDQSLPWYYIGGYLLFIGNWVYAVFGAPRSICAPLWTVSIEEQFYLIWPAVMRGLSRRGIRNAGIFLFTVSMASQLGAVLLGAHRGHLEYGSASRVNSLALGILLALHADQLPTPKRYIRLLLLVGGFTGWVFASAAWASDRPMHMVFGRVLAAVASGAILYGCLHTRSSLCTGAWVVSLGKISYGLYMFHFMGLVLAPTLFHPSSRGGLLGTRVLALATTWLLASASYRWLESPFLRMKDRFAAVLSRPV
jgi:peptidoglycan/LPS O-acetylase OafA/YrhL